MHTQQRENFFVLIARWCVHTLREKKVCLNQQYAERFSISMVYTFRLWMGFTNLSESKSECFQRRWWRGLRILIATWKDPTKLNSVSSHQCRICLSLYVQFTHNIRSEFEMQRWKININLPQLLFWIHTMNYVCRVKLKQRITRTV